jgi:hypothetical protein
VQSEKSGRIQTIRILSMCVALSCAWCVVAAPLATAATIESFDNGWYSQANNASNDFTGGVSNINVGWNSVTGATYRNWLAFDLSGLAGQSASQRRSV